MGFVNMGRTGWVWNRSIRSGDMGEDEGQKLGRVLILARQSINVESL